MYIHVFSNTFRNYMWMYVKGNTILDSLEKKEVVKCQFLKLIYFPYCWLNMDDQFEIDYSFNS